MAPYRNSRTGGTRSTRTQIDHDVFEGLPVRHWRKKPISVTTAPEKENMNDMKARNLAWPELEMPRDSHLLPEMSQSLLRAARMPQAKQPIIAPSMEDDKEPGDEEDVDGELDTAFTAKRWAVVPKDLEGPEPEFLAKRRKGLPSIHGGAVATLGTTPSVRKTKIRKLDDSGESSVLEVLVLDGRSVDGEILEEEASPTQAPAPGTVVDGVGVVNAEGVVIAGDQAVPGNNRRRPPPPKRKNKGPGRGKKKKVAFAGAEGRPTAGESNIMLNGAVTSELGQAGNGKQEALGRERSMGDESMFQDGDEGSEEVSEGEEGEEGDREEGELTPTSMSPTPHESPPKDANVAPDGTKGQNESRPLNELHYPSSTSNLAAVHTPTLTEPLVTPASEPRNEPYDEPATEPPHLKADAMLMDARDKESLSDSGNTPFERHTIENLDKAQTDPDARMPLGFVGKGVHAMVDERSPEPASATKATPEVANRKSREAFAEHSVVQAAPDLPQTPKTEIIADPVLRSKSQQFHESEAEAKSKVSEETTQEPDVSLSLKPQLRPTSRASSELSTEVNKEPAGTDAALPATEGGPELSYEARQEPAMEATSEATSTSLPLQHEEADKENKSEPVLETIPGLMPQSMSDVPIDTAPIRGSQTGEDVVPPINQEPSAIESVVPVAVEARNVPPAEPAERRFSFTRPATSPKAPTPSPPTPIEDKFSSSLRPPWGNEYSPKAPTMSPPTPLDRSVPSSPDIPLAEQQFVLPPPIDAVHGRNAGPAPEMQNIADANRIDVEAAPEVEPRVNAQIPVEYDPLDGLAEPKVAHGRNNNSNATEQAVHFSDGEEDLLGSLERSLG